MAGHGVDANIFTVMTASYTDAGNGPAAPVTGRAEAILQPKLKQAEYFATTGRTADGRGTGDPGVATEATTDVGGGNSAAFIEDGDWISFNPYNLEDLSKVTFRVASGGAGGIIQLRYDAADGPLVAETPNIAPTGGWQTWRDVTINLPTTIPQGTHRLFIVFRHPTDTGGLMNLNWFKFTGKGAAVTAPPEVTASAEPVSGEAPLNVAFNATATDAENEAMTYAWDFGVPGTTTDTSTQEDPNYTYTAPGNYTATVTVTDASGAKSSASVEVRVTRPLDECPTGPVRSDEFDGTALDLNRWTVERPDTANPLSVSDGNLNLPIANGSMYGAGTTAKNIIVQDTPDGQWMATAKISASALNENYHQAGLRVWADDDNWASVHMIYAGGNRDFEFIYEANGNPRNEGDRQARRHPGGHAADVLRADRVRRHEPERVLLLQRHHVPPGRPARAAVDVQQPEDRAGGVVRPGAHHADGAVRLDPVRPGRHGRRRHQRRRRRLRGHDPRLGVAEDPRRPERDRQRRHLPDPGPAGRHLPDPQRRQEPDGPRRADGSLDGDREGQLRGHRPVPPGRDHGLRRRRELHEVRPHRPQRGRRDEKFEFIYENNSVARNEAADSTANIPATFPDDFYVRLTSDGTNVIGHYSTNGTDWTLVGRPAPLPANAKIGLFAFSNDGTGNPVAAFDSFTLSTPAARRRRRYAERPALRRPVRRRDARQDAVERDRA